MKNRSINIIGCGRVGTTLGYLLSKKTSYKVKSILDISQQSAQEAVNFIKEGESCPSYSDLKKADLWLITANDHSIACICSDLVKNNLLDKCNVVVHCSGLLGSEILNTARDVGCFTASIHPITSFAKPKITISNFKGTYCSFEGEEEAYKIINPLFRKIGGKVIKIKPEQKSTYHIAAVFASNYLISLMKIARDLFIQSGIDKKTAAILVDNLIAKTIYNAKNESPHLWKALTGPIYRNDIETISKHLDAIKNDTVLLHLYKNMGTVLLDMLSDDMVDKKQLRKLLKETC